MAMETGVMMDKPPYIDEESFIELGAPEWVWLAFVEELKEYFPDDEDSSDEAPSVCPHCRMAGIADVTTSNPAPPTNQEEVSKNG